MKPRSGFKDTPNNFWELVFSSFLARSTWGTRLFRPMGTDEVESQRRNTGVGMRAAIPTLFEAGGGHYRSLPLTLFFDFHKRL